MEHENFMDVDDVFDGEKLEERKAIEEEPRAIVFDGGNAVELTAIGIVLEAVEDKLIVKIDDYKTGYECLICNETGWVPSPRKNEPDIQCANCHGRGVTIVIPEIAKHLPTSGVILSVGPMTKNKIREREIAKAKIKDRRLALMHLPIGVWPEEIQIKEGTESQDLAALEYPENKMKVGQRIIFTAHVGSLIPFKGNTQLKIMREHEPLCIMFGADTGAKSFMELDEKF